MRAPLLIALLAMPIFNAPTPFAEALQSREVRSVLPTALTSEQLDALTQEMGGAILERAMISARMDEGELLQKFADGLDRYLRGELDLATFRLEIKDFLGEIGYLAAPDEHGSITDFASDARINLVIETNADMAGGYGQWVQGQNAASLDQWPAQEFYRAFNRKMPRTDWPERFEAAGGTIVGDRMLALRNSDVWTRLSRFGTPYPPFDFNSGMSVRRVDRDTAVAAGLIDRDTQIAPQTRGFNDDLQFSPAIRDAALRRVLEEQGYTFKGDTLTL